MNHSNTYHRYKCKISGGVVGYCAHIFALYFEKDQANFFGFGHRHDWEWVAVYTRDGEVTHGAWSHHKKTTTKKVSDIPLHAGRHMKFVYHKDIANTHAMRVASSTEDPENPYDQWVTPKILSWFSMIGDNGIRNKDLRIALNTHDYGSANVPTNRDNFITNLNRAKPSSYPTFFNSDSGW